jgi:Domain of unknown function (DUF4350)
LRRSTLIVIVVAVVVVLALAARFYISEADFNMENPSWNGLNHLTGVSMKPLYDTSALAGLGTVHTLLVVSPTREYTAQESSQVASFLQSGGRVVVLDDFGKADSLLRAIGSPITVYGVPLCDYENYHVNHSLPVVNSFNPAVETANVSELVLNHPASLNVSGGGYVLARTSSKAWLDYNDNSRLDGEEKMGIYTVAARASLGGGELIVVSDPDIGINGMVELGDNSAFLSGILQGDVLLDVAHGRDLTPLGHLYYALKYEPAVQAFLVLLLLGVCYLFVRRKDVVGLIRGREPEEEPQPIVLAGPIQEKDIKGTSKR